MSGVKFISRHEKATACGDSFAQQVGLIAQQYLDIHGSRTACCAISTNFSFWRLYQDHRWFFNKRVSGPNKTSL